MSVTGALVPGSTTGSYGVQERWQQTIEDAVTDSQVFASNIRDVGEIFNKINIRKFDRSAVQSLSSTVAGDALTYTGAFAATVTITPVAYYHGTAMSQNELAQIGQSVDGDFRSLSERLIAEYIDFYSLSNVVSLTQTGTSAYANSIDASTLRNAISVLRTTGRGMAELGKDTINFVVDATRLQDLYGIPELTQAHLLGVGQGPLKTGVLSDQLGIRIFSTNQVNKTGAGSDNPLFIPSAFGIGYNQRPMVRIETVELNHRVIVYVNFGSGIIHDVRAMNIKALKTL